MTEIWKDVVGYEGIYEVSDHGRVRTKEGKTTHSVRHGMRVWKSRVLKEKNPNGRDVRVSLWKNKKDTSHLVHRLVAYAFIPEIPGKTCINHIDGNPRNNHVSNLEWCNHQENNEHAFINGLMNTNMSVKLINDIGIEYEFISLSRAGKFLGRNKGYLSGLLNRNKNIATNKNNEKFIVIKL
ncbi:HNH endonuclease [Macrococcoides goetzii]|nr:NUMOD4 motif-containing HNH endonuclease [Macrococcus goetzii]TDM39854.1 HNH endonuclease [Macrococcus goetzii]